MVFQLLICLYFREVDLSRNWWGGSKGKIRLQMLTPFPTMRTRCYFWAGASAGFGTGSIWNLLRTDLLFHSQRATTDPHHYMTAYVSAFPANASTKHNNWGLHCRPWLCELFKNSGRTVLVGLVDYNNPTPSPGCKWFLVLDQSWCLFWIQFPGRETVLWLSKCEELVRADEMSENWLQTSPWTIKEPLLLNPKLLKL